MSSDQYRNNEYLTFDKFIDTYRSPPLRPTSPRYEGVETPPPLSDHSLDEEHEEREPAPAREKRTSLHPSLSDSLLLKLLGDCNYAETASRAAEELLHTLTPFSSWEDRQPQVAPRQQQMVAETFLHNVYRRKSDALTGSSAVEASHKLNLAIGKDDLVATSNNLKHSPGTSRTSRAEMSTQIATSFSGYHPPGSGSAAYFADESMQSTGPRELNVRPPPRPSLHSPSTGERGEDGATPTHNRRESLADSPALGKYTIGPDKDNAGQQLPAMHPSPSISTSGLAQTGRQNLPSLETTLSAISSSHEATFSARPSPGSMSLFGASPSPYSQGMAGSSSSLSPPRIPTAPAYYRTISRDTTDSNPSDTGSVVPSTGISTPASSVPGHSPGESASTPSTAIHEVDRNYAHSATSDSTPTTSLLNGSQFSAEFGNGSFRCTQPGCTAAPFQTQYLLNSHANVHSNTRPHFCPVAGCPRGPGGQGFKRKNEMIRHGLVHQSPGYVCPFCPDQQHRYPRPDNLQRHVRVHHGDRERVDPLLRDVLAQRPEGGSRGRRRRLGS